MNNPYEKLSDKGLKRLFAIFTGLALVLLVLLRLLGSALITDVSPGGMVSLELAGRPDTIQQALALWWHAGARFPSLARQRSDYSIWCWAGLLR